MRKRTEGQIQPTMLPKATQAVDGKMKLKP